MVKSHSASNSPVTNKEFDSTNSSHSKLRKMKQKKLRGVTTGNVNFEEDTSLMTTSSLGNLSGRNGIGFYVDLTTKIFKFAVMTSNGNGFFFT